MIITGTDMGVAAQAVIVLPDNKDHLAVGLQPDDAIGDMDTRFLKIGRPAVVGLLVKTGLECKHHRDLLSIV